MGNRYEEHERRLRNLLRRLNGEGDRFVEDFLATDPQTHSEAAGLVLATSEALEGLVRNGADLAKLKADLFGILASYAEPWPFLCELIGNWAADGHENPDRLSELHDYNMFVREGKYREDDSRWSTE